MEQLYEFCKTKSGWWLRLTSNLDVLHYNMTFNRRRFEKATSNLLEGKEYGNKTMLHGPYMKEASISMTAYLRAQNKKNYATPKDAMAELYDLHEEYLRNLRKAIAENNEVYVNQNGGFTSKPPDEIIETIMASDFPT